MELSKSYTGKKSKTYQMAGIGIMAALISVLGPLSLPIGPVPISLTNLAIFVSLCSWNENGTISPFNIYYLVWTPNILWCSGDLLRSGLTGIFSGFIFMALIAGYFIDKFIDRCCLCVIGMILASTILCTFTAAGLSG